MTINDEPTGAERDFAMIDPPPVFRTWRHVYWLLIGGLILQIAVFYLLTVLLNESA